MVGRGLGRVGQGTYERGLPDPLAGVQNLLVYRQPHDLGFPAEVCFCVLMPDSFCCQTFPASTLPIALRSARGLSGFRRRFFTQRLPSGTKVPSRRK